MLYYLTQKKKKIHWERFCTNGVKRFELLTFYHIHVNSAKFVLSLRKIIMIFFLYLHSSKNLIMSELIFFFQNKNIPRVYWFFFFFFTKFINSSVLKWAIVASRCIEYQTFEYLVNNILSLFLDVKAYHRYNLY